MIYLDTHVVLWLYQADLNRFPEYIREILDREDVIMSPIVFLELEYLYEARRITEHAEPIVSYLRKALSLSFCLLPFSEVAMAAASFRWTRDPFDRLIVASAILSDSFLITKDKTIRRHYPKALWK